jgi:hypothetical protein
MQLEGPEPGAPPELLPGAAALRDPVGQSLEGLAEVEVGRPEDPAEVEARQRVASVAQA